MNVADVASLRLFDRDAAGYDPLRRALVPSFSSFYGTALDVIRRWHPGGPIRILDLGAGTGLFSTLIHERAPDAVLHLIDASPAMLDQARQRLVNVGDVEFRIDDISVADLGGSWNLIGSALAIHHLYYMEKQGLFCSI